jgi:hypothetical protein
LKASTVFFGVELEDFIVSSTSSTFTILLFLGVVARSFCAFGVATPAEGLITFNAFVFSTSTSSILVAFDYSDLPDDAFGIAAGFSVFCIIIGSSASVAEEVSPPNSGTVVGSMKRGQ